MQIMKSFFIESYGGLEVMKYGDIPEPVLSPGRILVQVKAVSINPVDYKIRQGDIRFITGSKFPKILGADFAGIVRISRKIQLLSRPVIKSMVIYCFTNASPAPLLNL